MPREPDLEESLRRVLHASIEELQQYPVYASRLATRLQDICSAQSNQPTTPESSTRTDDRAKDLENSPKSVGNLLNSIQNQRQAIIELLTTPVANAFGSEGEDENEDVRITDIQNASHQPMEKRFRKVLAARSLAREYGSWQFCQGGDPGTKSRFCETMGQRNDRLRKYVTQGCKILIFERTGTPGLSTLFAFLWTKAHGLNTAGDIPKFVKLFQKHEQALYKSLEEHEHWLHRCQEMYDERSRKLNEAKQQMGCVLSSSAIDLRPQQRPRKRSSQTDVQSSRRVRRQQPSLTPGIQSEEADETQPREDVQGDFNSSMQWRLHNTDQRNVEQCQENFQPSVERNHLALASVQGSSAGLSATAPGNFRNQTPLQRTDNSVVFVDQFPGPAVDSQLDYAIPHTQVDARSTENTLVENASYLIPTEYPDAYDYSFSWADLT